MTLKELDMKCVRMGKFLICCDSFKSTLTASDAGLAIERAIRRAETARGLSSKVSEVMHCPMSDGGAGLLESLFFRSTRSTESDLLQPKFTRVQVPANYIVGPLGEPLNPEKHSVYFACDVARRVVVIEMAVAAGLPIVPEEKKNPLLTTSYGVGQLINYAIAYVAKKSNQKNCAVSVYLGIGGSATNDGGLGALQALGVELLVMDSNAQLRSLSRPFTGRDLKSLQKIRFSDTCRQVFFSNSCETKGSPYCKEIHLICDVSNPLIGPHGATAVFGPQKCNASWDKDYRARVLCDLELGMINAAQCVIKSIKDDLRLRHTSAVKADLDELCWSAGGGGAGGMSGFFRDILQATWMQGTDAVAELLGLREKMKCCDFVITGEGSFDGQSIRYNKTIGRILQMVVLQNLEEQGKQKNERQKTLGIKDVMIICGRTNYRDSLEVRKALLSHMVDSQVKDIKHAGSYEDRCMITTDELAQAIPRIHLLTLTPRHFSVEDAMEKAGFCVEELVTKYLSGQTDVAVQFSHM